nr:DUF3667 domain-containing protein [uncultured Roseateles sp.]
MSAEVTPADDRPLGQAVQQTRCRNCGYVLGDPRPKFCAACGQDTSLKAPTVGEFIQHLGGNYVAMEGALWRTLALLLFRPGRLTLEYLAGRKRRYVLPVRLYLTISLFTLLLLRFTGAIQIPELDVDGKRFDAKPGTNLTFIEVDSARAGVDKNGVFYCEGLPDWMCRKLGYRFDLDPKNLKRQLSEAPERFVSHWGTAMFLLLPMFALWLKLVFIDRHRRYTEHLVFALHLHAFWFAMVLLALVGNPLLRALAALAIPIYTQMAQQRVYGGRWWLGLLRSVLLILLYGSTVSVALLLVMIWTVLS